MDFTELKTIDDKVRLYAADSESMKCRSTETVLRMVVNACFYPTEGKREGLPLAGS